ncbi:hypothetical protein FH582_21300 [Leptospira interrogans]|uniref:hypothetical protein n=1 Tax=Leptospira interrogans TaxID=173 RepID=UPI001F0D6D0A|nr:hypothetical protein [Leptospira interrogans]UMQ56326.1 hypothetical protein FH582_15950 [Leptospira interrogans]UMQ56354.1 hypothetical protein FH582_19120 [Leptospira interrogans]UMQ56379.1 hypothetical protein FH582_21300 [Leptospira interrogans]
MYNVAKEFAGMEGGTGSEVYQRAVKLEQEVKTTNVLRDVLKTEGNTLNVKRETAQAGLELVGVRNSEFLKAIRDPKSDNIPGIAELRKQLKGAKPEHGFSQAEMKSVSSWMTSSGLGSGLGKTNLGFGGGLTGGADSRMKGFIVSSALSIASAEEHGKLASALKDANTKLAEHRIKEDNIGRQMIERSNQAKAELVKLVQERHGNDPRFAEALVEHGLVKRDGLNTPESKVSYDEKLKAMGDKVKPDARKRLSEINEKITDLRVSQNKHEAESYAQWNKDHPNEPYKRTPDMEKRRNDMVTQQKKLEQERNTLINREVAPFSKESELHRLEKLADANAITEKQKSDLAALRNEKKTHENQVAALLDKDNAKLHETLENLDEKAARPMSLATTSSRLEPKTIEKIRSKDNAATKQLTWENHTYNKTVNEKTGEVQFEREYEKGVKEEISLTDSGYVKQKLSWKDILGNPQESTKVFEANGKFLTELTGVQPTKKLGDPNETRTIIPNEPKGKVVKSDFSEVKDLISNTNLSTKDRLEKIHSLDELEVNGKRYVKETVVTETKTGKKVTKDSEVTFFTLQNAGGQTERISFREVDSGYKDEKGKSIKTIEMKQLLAEGTVAEDTKLYDRFGTEKPDQDRAGNYPTFAENPKYYADRARQIFKEKGITPLLDSDGNFEYHNGYKNLVKTTNGFVDIALLTQTQRGLSYLGQTDKNGKPIVYALPGNKNGDVNDSSMCQSDGPATVMESQGLKMTQAEINEYGKASIMFARHAAEAGQMLPGKPKPSGMSIEQLSDLVFKPKGFQIPAGKEGSLIAKGSEGTPEEPEKKKYLDDPTGYAEAKQQYDQDLLAFKKQFQKEHLIPWIQAKLDRGEKVVVGGDFTKDGHVVTITGITDTGFYVSDSNGDANKKKVKIKEKNKVTGNIEEKEVIVGYTDHDGKMNHYKFEDFTLGYAYVLKPTGQKPLTEPERKAYLKDVTSYPGLKKQQATLSSSIESLEKIVKNATDEKKREESNRKLEEQRENLETTKEEMERIRKQWKDIWKP